MSPLLVESKTDFIRYLHMQMFIKSFQLNMSVAVFDAAVRTLYSGLSLIRTLRGNLNLLELWRVRIRGSRSFLKYFGNRNRYYQPE